MHRVKESKENQFKADPSLASLREAYCPVTINPDVTCQANFLFDSSIFTNCVYKRSTSAYRVENFSYRQIVTTERRVRRENNSQMFKIKKLVVLKGYNFFFRITNLSFLTTMIFNTFPSMV